MLKWQQVVHERLQVIAWTASELRGHKTQTISYWRGQRKPRKSEIQRSKIQLQRIIIICPVYKLLILDKKKWKYLEQRERSVGTNSRRREALWVWDNACLIEALPRGWKSQPSHNANFRGFLLPQMPRLEELPLPPTVSFSFIMLNI